MEENQNDLLGQMPEQPAPADAWNGEGETAPAAACAVTEFPVDSACDAQEGEIQEVLDAESEAPVAPTWEFGGEVAPPKKKKKGGRIAFFSVFGSVLVICLALLILLLFVGENGIQIIRILRTERVVYVREDDGTSGMLTPQEAADVVRKSTVTISVKMENGTGTGSGFVYDANGHIVTNYHVIEDAVLIQVVLPDGIAYDAEVVGYNEPADLAVLRVQASGLVPAAIGSSSSLLVGDEVVAVGTPASITFAGTATFGRVSCTSRLLLLDDDADGVYESKITVIQTDTSVNPGNSGGPMADMYGRVIGIVVRKILTYNGSNYEGLGFAIPIDGAKVILDAIIRDGSFTGRNPIVEGRSVLGVTGHGGKQGFWYYVDPLTNAVKEAEVQTEGYHYMPVDGVYAIEVQGGNAKGKILAGDVILAVNGFAVRDTRELITAVNCYPCGTTVSLRIWRNGTEMTVQVILGEG